MDNALPYLFIGALGVLAVRYGERIAAVSPRRNEPVYRKLPRTLRVLTRRCEGVMAYMLAGWGYLCIVIAVAGLTYSLEASLK